jgi:hypothetical protein
MSWSHFKAGTVWLEKQAGSGNGLLKAERIERHVFQLSRFLLSRSGRSASFFDRRVVQGCRLRRRGRIQFSLKPQSQGLGFLQPFEFFAEGALQAEE